MHIHLHKYTINSPCRDHARNASVHFPEQGWHVLSPLEMGNPGLKYFNIVLNKNSMCHEIVRARNAVEKSDSWAKNCFFKFMSFYITNMATRMYRIQSSWWRTHFKFSCQSMKRGEMGTVDWYRFFESIIRLKNVHAKLELHFSICQA